MRTTIRIKKLEKLTGIVELLQRAYNHAEEARCDLYHFDNYPRHNRFLFVNREQLSDRRIHWLNVAQRLEQYYDNTAKGLFNVSNAIEIGGLEITEDGFVKGIL